MFVDDLTGLIHDLDKLVYLVFEICEGLKVFLFPPDALVVQSFLEPVKVRSVRLGLLDLRVVINDCFIDAYPLRKLVLDLFIVEGDHFRELILVDFQFHVVFSFPMIKYLLQEAALFPS